MSYTNVQLRVLMRLSQVAKVNDEVVFGFFVKNPALIYTAVRYKKWAPIVNIIQGAACGHSLSNEDIFRIIYCDARLGQEKMAVEMISFFNSFKVKIHPEFIEPPSYSAEFDDAVHSYFYGNVKWIHLDARDVSERQALDSCIVQFAGEPPHADLNNWNEARYYHRLYLALAYNRAGFRGFFRPPQGDWGHNIAAVLATHEGQVLAVSYNQKNINVTFHAEVNLVQAAVKRFPQEDFHQQALFIYTTLKPCKMCASMIACVFPNSKVIYGQNDPGNHAKDIMRPAGGVCSLHELNAKPLYAYDGTPLLPNSQKIGDISQLLSSNEVSVTKNLNKDSSATNMFRAGQSIDRKLEKYNKRMEAKQSHPKVAAILRHLQPIMTS